MGTLFSLAPPPRSTQLSQPTTLLGRDDIARQPGAAGATQPTLLHLPFSEKPLREVGTRLSQKETYRMKTDRKSCGLPWTKLAKPLPPPLRLHHDPTLTPIPAESRLVVRIYPPKLLGCTTFQNTRVEAGNKQYSPSSRLSVPPTPPSWNPPAYKDMAPPSSQLIMPPVPGNDPSLFYGATSDLTRLCDTHSIESYWSSDPSDDDDDESALPILGHRQTIAGYQTMAQTDHQGAAAPATQTAHGGGGNVKDRMCPNMRGCWSFSWEAYSLRTADKAVLFRRICMYVILGIRTALSVIGVVRDITHARVAGFIIGIILGVIGFFFIAWCLAVIGQAEGRRKVLGVMVGRWHFDIFLLVTAFIHAALLVGSFFGLGSAGGYATWLIMWLLLFLVAWIGTWPAEQESYV
ncbi:hypothetical protein CTA1_4417 [Colletotrichum tanaceti]|uniref:Uncharacterized protein n=1 Tax=Colletotrichum tanaceti TaxID=1306861 RepID=A0A4U6X1X8_9PEZI|nr:hypothetical protein CTA1_4417 [Colletotrichum tanaceti]